MPNVTEEFPEEHIDIPEFKVTMLHENEYLKNTQLNKSLNHIEEQITGDCTPTKSGGIYSDVHNFYINTEKVTFIENADRSYHSYTFQISRPGNDDGPLENLLFSLQPDGTYKTILVAYNLTEDEKRRYFLGNDIDFSGKVSSRVIEDGDLSSLLLKVATTNCVWIIRTWCAGDNHEDGYINGEECPAHRSEVELYCIGGSGSDGGSTGGGSTSAPGEGGTTDPNTGSGGSGGGSGEPSGGNVDDDVTAPTCADCVSYSFMNRLLDLGIKETEPADIIISNPYLIDLSTFLIEGDYISWDRYGGFYYKCQGLWVYVRNNQFYVCDPGAQVWYKAVLRTYSLSGELTNLIGTSALEAAQFVGTYLLPVEDFYILMTGEDFDGLASNQYAAGAFLLLEVIPGTKLLKPVANVLGDATKYFFKYGDNLLDLVKVNGVVKFTDDAVLKLAEKATNNKTSNKVLLGKFFGEDNPLSYRNIAEDGGCCYYNLEKWNELYKLVNYRREEMLKINYKFLDDRLAKGDEIYFSFDPWKADGFLEDEALYLIDLNAKDFEQISNDLWKVIW